MLTLFQYDCSSQNVGYVFGSSTRGQRALYEVGLTGIPISNCNNNCSTGATALFQSRALVAGGMARCALALGFEKMQVHFTCVCKIFVPVMCESICMFFFRKGHCLWKMKELTH